MKHVLIEQMIQIMTRTKLLVGDEVPRGDLEQDI